jgi:nucleoside-diphosphate-sugar epimerase
MPVFVTGASGFLGGRLVEVLSARGDEVIILARKNADISHLSGLPIRIVRGDLSDVEFLRNATQDASRIYHCAACSTDWAKLETYQQANVVGTQNLLLAARDASRLDRFVYISTCDVYGYPRVPCDESHPMKDMGLPYNSTKCQAESAVWQAHRESGLPFAILRPTTIYGPRGKAFTVDIADLLREGWMAYIGSGKAPGGFAYVDNVVDAILLAGDSEQALGQVFNVSDGTGATWAEYATQFATSLGYRRPRLNLPFPVAMAIARVMETPYAYTNLKGRPPLTRHAVYLLGVDQEFPIEKAKRLLGFTPKVGLSEGIERSVEWLKSREKR